MEVCNLINLSSFVLNYLGTGVLTGEYNRAQYLVLVGGYESTLLHSKAYSITNSLRISIPQPKAI